MFWKGKPKQPTRQPPTTREMFAMGMTREDYYRRQARAVEMAAQYWGVSRKRQIAEWYRLIQADIGETPRQVDCALAFGLTQGRISQLMH